MRRPLEPGGADCNASVASASASRCTTARKFLKFASRSVSAREAAETRSSEAQLNFRQSDAAPGNHHERRVPPGGRRQIRRANLDGLWCSGAPTRGRRLLPWETLSCFSSTNPPVLSLPKELCRPCREVLEACKRIMLLGHLLGRQTLAQTSICFENNRSISCKVDAPR